MMRYDDAPHDPDRLQAIHEPMLGMTTSAQGARLVPGIQVASHYKTKDVRTKRGC